MNCSQPLLRILHLSDLHCGAPYVTKVADAFQRLVPQLQADAIVVSGDFTHRAETAEFEAAVSFLEQLPDVPRLYVPGNHDVPLYRLKDRLFCPHSLYQKHVCSELNPVLALKHATIVGIDSTAPRTAISNGRVNQWQLDAAERAFEDGAVGAARIIVAHHHFAPAPDYLRDRTMPKAKRAITRFIENGVDIILGGHLHRAYIGNTLDVFPGVHRERGIVVVQSGTTTSRRGRAREREKNSFNTIDIAIDSMTVTHYLYFDADTGFIPSSRHQFPRGLLPLPAPTNLDDRTHRIPVC